MLRTTLVGTTELAEESIAPPPLPPPPPPPPPMEWDDEPEEDDPYEVYVLRRPHERSSTVLQHLVKQPEMADTRLRYRRTAADDSYVPSPFEFPTRPSMLESLTDTDDDSEVGSRRRRSTFSRRSFSVPSSSGTITSLASPQPPRRRPVLPPGLPKAPKNNSESTEADVKRRDTMPAIPSKQPPSMLGYPPNAKPPVNYKGSSARRKENRLRQASIYDVGGRKITAPAAYGASAAANFALVVESPKRTPRAPRTHAPPTQWPPLPSEWPPTAPALAAVPSSGIIPLRVEATVERQMSNNSKSKLRTRRARKRADRNTANNTKPKSKSKRRNVMRTSARLRTYLRTARGRERAATGAATRRAPATESPDIPGMGVERDRDLSIVSANGNTKDEKNTGRAALRRVLSLLRFNTVQRTK